jgi:hypothetical protein
MAGGDSTTLDQVQGRGQTSESFQQDCHGMSQKARMGNRKQQYTYHQCWQKWLQPHLQVLLYSHGNSLKHSHWLCQQSDMSGTEWLPDDLLHYEEFTYWRRSSQDPHRTRQVSHWHSEWSHSIGTTPILAAHAEGYHWHEGYIIAPLWEPVKPRYLHGDHQIQPTSKNSMSTSSRTTKDSWHTVKDAMISW